MATATQSPTRPDASRLPQPIQDQLQRLRRRLTAWVTVRGLGECLWIVLGVLVVDMLADRIFKMDFAQRLIMLGLIGAVAGLVLVWRLIRPLRMRPSPDSLIYEVEHRHRELNESLLSAVQLSRQENPEALGVSRELMDATIATGLEQAGRLDFRDAVDPETSRRNWIRLAVAALLWGGLAVGVTQTAFLSTWFNRNILLGSQQWPQATYLTVRGANEGGLVLPRGIDHRQLVEITATSRVRDVDLELEVEGPDGMTRYSMKPTGKLDGREHAFVFHNVSSEFRFRALGGDAITDWVQVSLVEPPSISELELVARLPEYTGMPAMPLEGNGPHSLLEGSSLDIRVVTNKPLAECLLNNGSTSMPLRDEGDGQTFSGTLPGAEERLAGGDYAFELTDTTGLQGIRPTRFSLRLREDAPPKVRASLLGISGLVVPRARLPVSWSAQDEFALRRLGFRCQWTTGEESGPAAEGRRDVPFANPLGPDAVQEASDVEVLDLEPLELEPGTSFRFVVEATDNCPEPPGTGQSQEFLLRIVTEEELRADLLRREIEQRKAFEQIYNSQLELMTELQAVTAMQPRPSQDADAFRDDREKRLIALTREQKALGTRLSRIADRFEEFLVEVKNNRLDERENELAPDQRIEQRFDLGIVRPIRELDQVWFEQATRELDNCRRVVGEATELRSATDATVETQQEILRRMQQILSSMMDSENFQEVINKLLEIGAAERRLIEESQQRSKADDIFDDDVFDKQEP